MAAPVPVKELVISAMSDGSVRVAGPINEKMFCYGLLEVARDQIRDFKQSVIQPVTKFPGG